MAWSACNDLPKNLVFDLNNKIKINSTFENLIKLILLYGSGTWTLYSKQQEKLDGTCTRLLMRVKNLSWKRHATKQQIYSTMPLVSLIIK